MLSFISHSENANQNHKIPLHTHKDDYIFLKSTITNVGEDTEKLGPSYAAGRMQNGAAAVEKSGGSSKD